MNLQQDVLAAIDLALSDDLRDRQAAEQVAQACDRYSYEHRFDLPSLIWGFIAFRLRDPDYLASERRITELGALREGRAGPRYIFMRLGAHVLEMMGTSGGAHLAAAERMVTALLAQQPPPYEQITAAVEVFQAWTAQEDPDRIYVYLLTQIWSIVAKTDPFSLLEHGVYGPISGSFVGDTNGDPVMDGLLEWAAKAVEFLYGRRTMTLCWEYTRGRLAYHFV